VALVNSLLNLSGPLLPYWEVRGRDI
jgi:hypothetical protein